MTPLPWWQRLFAVLFILCFSAATVFLLLRYWNVVHTMSTVASWVEVPVSMSGWEEKSTTTPSYRSGKVLQQVKGQYRYQWEGETYTSDEVSLGQSADNFSHRQRKEMREALSDPSPTAWVNPQNPQQSLMVRSFPWEKMLFDVSFMLFPCGFISFIVCVYISLAIKKWWFPPSLPRRLWGAWHGLLLLPLLYWGWSSFSFGAWLIIMAYALIVGLALLAPTLKSSPPL